MAAAGPHPQALTSTSECRTPLPRRPYLRLLTHLAALAVASYAVGLPSLGALSFVSGHHSGPAAPFGVQGHRDRRGWATTLQAVQSTRMKKKNPGILLLKKRPTGFALRDRRILQDYQGKVYPMLGRQKHRFWTGSKRGDYVSEVYMRFPGKTPWKRVGEVSHEVGNYEEAIVAQWPLLVDNAFIRHPKARFFCGSKIPIQFAYADENAELVPVTAGPLAEGTRPLIQKTLLQRCGFLAEGKDPVWMSRYEYHETFLRSSKKQHHLEKPYLMLRKMQKSVSPLGTKWYNPYKWRGNYGWHFKKSKRGPLFVHGTSRFR